MVDTTLDISDTLESVKLKLSLMLILTSTTDMDLDTMVDTMVDTTLDISDTLESVKLKPNLMLILTSTTDTDWDLDTTVDTTDIPGMDVSSMDRKEDNTINTKTQKLS